MRLLKIPLISLDLKVVCLTLMYRVFIDWTTATNSTFLHRFMFESFLKQFLCI